MELQQYNKVFPELVKSLVANYEDSDVQKATLWLKDVMEYNVPHGKKTGGIFVVKAFQCFSGTENTTAEDLYLIRVLGWCTDMLIAYIIVADDIMDKSELRRGKACWYKKEGVGLIAVNDLCSIQSCMYMLLNRHFREKKYFINIVELFQEVTLKTVLGQSLDMQTNGQLDLSKFTVEAYSALVKYKTAHFLFYLPIALAMIMAGISDAERLQRVKEVLLAMGHLYQVHDDFIDCFGDPLITGKIGTDVEEGKCSWLVVTALQYADETQKNIIKKNYGRNEPECKAKIKALYDELSLEEKYKAYEGECYKKIEGLIKQMEGMLPTEIFYELINVVYTGIQDTSQQK